MFVPLMGAFVQGAKKVYSQKESFLVVMGGPIPGVLFGVVGAVIAFQYQMSWMLELSAVFILLYFYHPIEAGYLACLCALYDERTNGPLSTYIKPISKPRVSYFLNCSGVTNSFRGKCFFVGCKY